MLQTVENITFWVQNSGNGTFGTRHFGTNIFLWKIQIFSITVHVNISYELTNLCVDILNALYSQVIRIQVEGVRGQDLKISCHLLCNVIGIRFT